MLNGLSSTGQLEAATSLLSHQLAACAMGRRDAEGLASIVLNACADAGRMDLTRGVLTSMRSNGVPFGLLTFCILIKGYGRAGAPARSRTRRGHAHARRSLANRPQGT